MGVYNNEKAEQIFNIYYAMGKDRSLVKLEQLLREKFPNNPELNPSIATLKRWSRQYNWQLRIQQRQVEETKRLRDQIINDIVDEKAEYRKILRGILSEGIKSIKKLKDEKRILDIKHMRDYRELVSAVRELIELEMELVGERDEGITVNITGDLIPKK